MNEVMQSEFGRLLKKYRNNSSDPERGGKLTQERLAELLESRVGMPGYSTVLETSESILFTGKINRLEPGYYDPMARIPPGCY